MRDPRGYSGRHPASHRRRHGSHSGADRRASRRRQRTRCRSLRRRWRKFAKLTCPRRSSFPANGPSPCWLIPRLSEFQDRQPEIDLHLSVGGGGFDFARDHITLAIRRLDFAIDANWQVERLIEEEVGPVMHPAMADRFAAGGYVALAAKTRPDAWQKWSAAHPDAPRSTRFLDHHFLMVEAAAGGLGVAMCAKIIALDDIRKGRLAAPLGFKPDGSHTASFVRRWRRRRLGSINLCRGFSPPFTTISMRCLEPTHRRGA